MPGIIINGIVSARTQEPFVQMDADGKLIQLSVAQARSIAQDLLSAAARAEVDAMIWKFWKELDLPRGAAEGLFQQFRDFRMQLDEEKVERTYVDPDDPERHLPRD